MNITVPDELPADKAFQLALGELVEWSAGKADTELVMTALVALAGAVGRGSGIYMDDSGLRVSFDHGFNSEEQPEQRV